MNEWIQSCAKTRNPGRRHSLPFRGQQPRKAPQADSPIEFQTLGHMFRICVLHQTYADLWTRCYRWRHWGSELGSNMPKDIQALTERVRCSPVPVAPKHRFTPPYDTASSGKHRGASRWHCMTQRAMHRKSSWHDAVFLAPSKMVWTG